MFTKTGDSLRRQSISGTMLFQRLFVGAHFPYAEITSTTGPVNARQHAVNEGIRAALMVHGGGGLFGSIATAHQGWHENSSGVSHKSH